MEKLPGIVLDKFLEGDNVMSHKKGIWNGIWFDMVIETTYMKYGKGPSGLIGITTNPRSCSNMVYQSSYCQRDIA